MMSTPFDNLQADLAHERIEGVLASDTRRRIDLPLISHITDNLYVGGHSDYADLGDFFTHVFSLYVWGAPYRTAPSTKHASVKIQDAHSADVSEVVEFVEHIVEALEAGGNVLVHCQAGINRSNLAAALVLRKWKGLLSGEAIDLLRRKRGAIVLANSGFERYLRGLDNPVPVEDYPNGR